MNTAQIPAELFLEIMQAVCKHYRKNIISQELMNDIIFGMSMVCQKMEDGAYRV